MGREPLTTGELRGNGERSEPSIGRTDGGFWRRQTRTSEKNSERLRGGRGSTPRLTRSDANKRRPIVLAYG